MLVCLIAFLGRRRTSSLGHALYAPLSVLLSCVPRLTWLSFFATMASLSPRHSERRARLEAVSAIRLQGGSGQWARSLHEHAFR